jgi:hypothetical protein
VDDSLYDDPPLTLRQLLHQMTDEDALLDQPVHLFVQGASPGKVDDCLVTGLSVGRGVQSLTFELNRDGR